GSVIVETQQNSDTTFRLYDYGRPRELHIEPALQATREQTHAGRVVAGQPHVESGKVQANLVTSPCFIVDKFHLARAWEFRRPRHEKGWGGGWAPTGGAGVFKNAHASPVTFACGESVVIPATVSSFMLKPQRELEFLCASLPVEKVGQPATIMAEAAA